MLHCTAKQHSATPSSLLVITLTAHTSCPQHINHGTTPILTPQLLTPTVTKHSGTTADTNIRNHQCFAAQHRLSLYTETAHNIVFRSRLLGSHDIFLLHPSQSELRRHPVPVQA